MTKKRIDSHNVLGLCIRNFAVGLLLCSSGVAWAGVATASGSSESEACYQAQQNAGQSAGGCSCEQRGGVYICRVQYSSGEDDSALDGARRKSRELLSCDPDKEVCKSPTNGGPGRRG